MSISKMDTKHYSFDYVTSCLSNVEKIENKSLASTILRLQKPSTSSTSSSSEDTPTVKPTNLYIRRSDDDGTSTEIDIIEFMNDYLRFRHTDSTADALSLMNMDIYSDAIILSACIDCFLIMDDAIDLLGHKKEHKSMTGNSHLRCIKFGVFERINTFVSDSEFGMSSSVAKDKIGFDYFAALAYVIVSAASMKLISTNLINGIDINKKKTIFENCLLDRLTKFMNVIHHLKGNELQSKYPNKSTMLMSTIGNSLRVSCLYIKKASEDDNFSRICSVGKGKIRLRDLSIQNNSVSESVAKSDDSINTSKDSISINNMHPEFSHDDMAVGFIIKIGKTSSDTDSYDSMNSVTDSASDIMGGKSSCSSVVLSNLLRRKKTKFVESRYGGSLRSTVLPKGVYQVKSGFRIQLNQIRGSSQKFSRNATSFVEAIWLFEIAMLMADKPKYLYLLQIAGNYSAILSMDIGVTNSLQYYLELGNWISYLSKGGSLASSRGASLTLDNSQLASKIFDDLIPITIDQVNLSPSSSNSSLNSLSTEEKMATLSAKDRGLTCLSFPMPNLFSHICLSNNPPRTPFLYSSLEYDTEGAALAFVAIQEDSPHISQNTLPCIYDDVHV